MRDLPPEIDVNNLARLEETVRDIPLLIRLLFQQLRRRQFPLGIDDYLALQQGLRAGFGLASREALCDLCAAGRDFFSPSFSAISAAMASTGRLPVSILTEALA